PYHLKNICKNCNGNNGKHPTIAVKTVRLQMVRPRLATSVRLLWAAGHRSQHLLRSAGETNIPARGEAGRSKSGPHAGPGGKSHPGAWLIRTPSVLPSVYK